MPSRWLLAPFVLVALCVYGCGAGSMPPPPPPTNPVAIVSFVYPSTLPASAPFTITIIGSQFVSGAQVLLGSTPLSVTFVDGSHLTATGIAPAAVGSANLTVTNVLTNNTPSNPLAVTVAAISQRAAVRFLEQSTFGPSDAQLLVVETGGMESFLMAQFQAPVSNYPDPPPMPPDLNFMFAAFFQNALDSKSTSDQLRQRVAFALNQIWVVSINKVGQADYYIPYLRVLSKDAFGNYRTIMEDVTLNPAMGRYLDMLNNAKPDVANGIHANENYAREFMQLFTIGPNLLNPDGTPQLQNGAFVATYSQADIQALARVFTGWTYSPSTNCSHYPNYNSNGGSPMVPCDSNHDVDAKALLGASLPPGQTAQQDLKGALDTIFNQPNLPPFVAHRFIQHLVTSNPSQAYVTRAANAFISGTFTSNGTTFGVSGDRGNMQALLAAILLDPEARRGDDPSKENPLDGHLREPILLTTSIHRAFHAVTGSDSNTVYFDADMGQFLFQSPSVFNFFSPLFNIPLKQPPLSGPEFQIFTSANSLSRVNHVESIFFDRNPSAPTIDLIPYLSLASNDAGIMVDAMNLQLLHGTMLPAMRTAVLNAVNAVPSSDATTRVETAAYLITSSPQYQVQR